MDYRKYLVEVGVGIDLHGMDETKAAKRAVKDAISHCSMVGLSELFIIEDFQELSNALLVDVTVATPNPEKIDENAVLEILPEGESQINVIRGGIKFPAKSTNRKAKTHGIVMVNAIIVVLVDVDSLKRK